jgi:hypothetical protein
MIDEVDSVGDPIEVNSVADLIAFLDKDDATNFRRMPANCQEGCVNPDFGIWFRG